MQTAAAGSERYESISRDFRCGQHKAQRRSPERVWVGDLRVTAALPNCH